MLFDSNQSFDKILGGPKTNDEYTLPKTTWILLRSVIRKQKIEKIYEKYWKEKF